VCRFVSLWPERKRCNKKCPGLAAQASVPAKMGICGPDWWQCLPPRKAPTLFAAVAPAEKACKFTGHQV
jgi:hypothetical protein